MANLKQPSKSSSETRLSPSSVLGPILWNIYMDDLLQQSAAVVAYASDCTLPPTAALASRAPPGNSTASPGWWSGGEKSGRSASPRRTRRALGQPQVSCVLKKRIRLSKTTSRSWVCLRLLLPCCRPSGLLASLPCEGRRTPSIPGAPHKHARIMSAVPCPGCRVTPPTYRDSTQCSDVHCAWRGPTAP